MVARAPRALRTVDLARAADAHPNTVRLYAERGFLPPVPRSPTGYRLFEPRHLDHMRVARLLLRDRWPGRVIRRSAMAVLVDAASRGLPGSVPAFREHLALVRRERAAAEHACEVARGWLGRQGVPGGTAAAGLRMGEAVARLNLTYETVRGWERSGLVRVAREPGTGHRRFGPAELDRLAVIRMLRQAGYSVMAVLRMLAAADQGEWALAIGALADPAADEDLVTAGDRWVVTLREHEGCAGRAVELVTAIVDISANPPLAHQGHSVRGE